MGIREEHAVLFVNGACLCGCRFCTRSGGRMGRPAEELSQQGPIPGCRTATVMAADMTDDRLVGVITKIADAGTEEIYVYAHPACSDAMRVKALHDAGATGLHLLLPAADRPTLGALCGRAANLANVAMLIRAANSLRMNVRLEIPVLAENRATIADTVSRALGMIDAPAGISLPFRAPHDGSGPAGWDFRDAVPSVLKAMSVAAARNVPVDLGGSEGAPPCVLNPADARVEWYPGMDSGRTPGTTAERPLEQCGSCRAAPSCVSAMRGFAPGHGNPLRPVDDVRPIETCAVAMFVRRADLDRLLAEASRIDRCTAPWDSLEAHDRTGRAAPCEGSWPRRDVIGNPDGEGGGWLRDGLLRSFNAPSMVAMRRAMVAGGRAASCRPACPRFGESWRDRSPTRLPRTAVFHENLMLNLREFIDGADVLRSRPLSITISPSLKCNQACRMCDLADPSAGPLDVRVPDAILDEVAMLLPTTATLAITGGEPLTSRRIIDIIAGITPKTLPDTRVTLTTNGTLLRPETIARFERSNLASVYISLNAATAATHALVTGVDGAFAGVVENARAMVAASRKMPMKPDVSLSFVVMRSTIGELDRFIELARAIGAGVRLLPIERDRLGESIFTDPDVAANAAEKIRGLLFRLRGTWPDAAVELSRLDRLIRARMADNDYSPM